MIFAVSDMSYQVTVDHLIAAKSVLEYSNQTIDYVFGNHKNTSSPLDRITNFIKIKGGQCNRTAISYDVFHRKISALKLDNYRDQLISTNQIEIINQDKTEFWLLVGDVPI